MALRPRDRVRVNAVQDIPRRKLPAPTPPMLAALRGALRLEQGAQGEPWVVSRYRRTCVACVRRGLATEYQITPGGRVYYRISEAGRRYVAAHAPAPTVPVQMRPIVFGAAA